MPKEVQPSYVIVNMPKDTVSIDSASIVDNISIKRADTSERSRKGESDNEESSQKTKKKDISESIKEDVDSIKNSSNDEKNSKFNPIITVSSCDSNLSESSNTPTKPSLSKRDNSYSDLKSNIRSLKIIKEDNHPSTSNPDCHVDDIERITKSHMNNNGSFDNRYENESYMKKRLIDNIKYNNNFKSDRTLSRNDKHISSVADVKMANNSTLLSNMMTLDDPSMVSVNSMKNYKTMCNVNGIESTGGSMDVILKTGTLKHESQSYSSRIDVSDAEKMLDSDKFKNVGQERNLYDKKGANIKLHDYAQEIYDKYICPGSVYELNISSKTVKKLTEIMGNTRKDQLFSENIFNQAYIEVLRNIYLTSFQKFLKYGKEDEPPSLIKRESETPVADDDGYYKEFDFN